MTRRAASPAHPLRTGRLRVLAFVLAALAGLMALAPAAEARMRDRVVARVDIASQRMVVEVGGKVRHVWRVSTARRGFVTPRGSYAPKRLHARYFSKKYAGAPMPYAVFFRGGYAVHGTIEGGRLGSPASHGCIRLAIPNARALFRLIEASGPGGARIVIT